MGNDVQPAELTQLFRDNLRRRRCELGISQAELAARIEAHRPYISDIESGKKTPGLGTLARLASALHTSPQALLTKDVFSSLAS